ncbi:unnamed protein product, partial [Ixodes pacificus]
MGDTSSGSVLPSDNLRTEEGFRAALRRMQKFAGLPATGRLDQATARMMKARRCGVPDVIGHAERVRRYALQGSKWDKTHLTWSEVNARSEEDRRIRWASSGHIRPGMVFLKARHRRRQAKIVAMLSERMTLQIRDLKKYIYKYIY